MKTSIYLVRHGEVTNPQQIWYGRLPGYRLSEVGKTQIAQTAEYLISQHIDGLYSSAIFRAKQSAEIIQQKLRLANIHFSPELLEIKTSFQGQTFAAAHALHDNVFASANNNFVGETINQVADRIQKFVKDIIQMQVGKHIVAVSHGDLLMLARAWVAGLPLRNDSIRPTDGSYIKHGEVYLLTSDENETLQLESVFKPD